MRSEDDKDERFLPGHGGDRVSEIGRLATRAAGAAGYRRMLRRGELVFKAGQRDLGLTVILSGEVEVF